MAYPLEANPLKHYYTTRRGSILGIVLHVTAGAQDLGMVGQDGSAASTIAYSQKTDRPSSYHGIVDSDSVTDTLPDSYTAFGAVGYNSRCLHLEIANLDAVWAGKPARWVEATLRNAAAWCAPRVARYGLPLRLADKASVDAALATGRPFGFTYHAWLDPTRRRDPGRDFPWQQFAGYLITPALAQSLEDDMPYTRAELEQFTHNGVLQALGDPQVRQRLEDTVWLDRTVGRGGVDTSAIQELADVKTLVLALTAQVAALAGQQTTVDVDEAEIARTLVASLPTELAAKVADELAVRLGRGGA